MPFVNDYSETIALDNNFFYNELINSLPENDKQKVLIELEKDGINQCKASKNAPGANY